MTNVTPGTPSPVTPPPVGDVKLPTPPVTVPPVVLPEVPAATVVPPLVPEKPTEPEKTFVSPQPPISIPAPTAKPFVPPAPPSMPAMPPVPPSTFIPQAAIPSPVTPPRVDTASAPVDAIKVTNPVTGNLVSPVVGAVPSTTVVSTTTVTPPGGKPPTKSNGAKVKFIAPLLLLFFLVFGGGIAFFLSQRQQNIQNQASSTTSKGTVEQLSCGQITGWTCDSANYSKALKVAVYYDEFKESNLVTIVDANVNRASAAEQCGGTTNHGFVIDIPSEKVPAGTHTFIVKGVPVGATNSLNTADMFNLQLASNVSPNVSCGSISQSCSMSFTATEGPQNAISCVKDSYEDELSNSAGQYAYTTRKTSFDPGEVVLFHVTLKNNGQQVQQFSLVDALTENNLDQLDFIDTSCGTYNATTRTVTWATNPVAAGDTIDCGIRARVKRTLTQALVITNTAEVTAGSLSASCTAPITVTPPGTSPSPSPSVSPSPSPSPSASPYVCGQSCSTTSQCGSGYVCATNGSANYCMLEACASGAYCSNDKCSTLTASPTPSPSVSPSPSPAASPYICGQSCSTTSQCGSGYTCASNGSGNYCMLNSCAAGAYCSNDKCSTLTPEGTPIPTPTPTVITYVYSSPTTTYATPTVTAYIYGTPQPSPAASCNEACNTNADCRVSSHICVDTAVGRRCRLDSNVGSETCSPTGSSAPIATPKPVKLPVAGSNDILKALGVGAVAVILGIVGLVLL